LTVEPNAIANNLSSNLVANFEIFAPAINLLLSNYGSTKTVPAWPDDDYDSI
jgi:hypothetical protein